MSTLKIDASIYNKMIEAQ